MSLTVAFAPLAAPALIAGAAGVASVLALTGVKRGRALRVLAIAAIGLALMNPALVREEREPLPDAVVVVTDESESMRIGERAAGAQALLAELRETAANDPTLELIEAAVPRGDDGTRLYDTLARALGEAPRGRLSAVVAITDGQVHDAPDNASALGVEAPVHALIVGDRSKSDRRLVVRQAPSFGIVGERTRFTLLVDEPGAAPGTRAAVSLSLDGADPLRTDAPVNEPVEVEIELSKRGANVVEITAEPGPNELTLVNNRTAVSVAGVRDRLRVLLVTGEPHAGARAWRDLLKSDPSVDLVHFTILRPPDKLDATPENELSLIRFPTQELFEEKLDDFDLVIFDRYRRRGVLRMLYFDNISRYVEGGGALMIAAGPPFASPFSIHRTPLAAVMPARPTGGVLEEPFRPALTETGRKHPVTAGFAPAEGEPKWGRWFRAIEATPVSGETLLEAGDNHPLLMLDRVQQGRVALFLSDEAWLWSRGVEGGGPYGELFRRLAHWLMKEPDLEEERLTAEVSDGEIAVERRTLGDAPDAAEVIAPSGEEISVPLAQTAPGVFAGTAPVDETGLHRVRSGDLTTVAAAGPLNPREYADLTPTDTVMGPLAETTGGGVFFVGEGGAARAPSIRRTRAGDAQAGRAWMGLPRSEAYVTTAQDRRPLAPALAAAALLLGLLAAAWAREGR